MMYTSLSQSEGTFFHVLQRNRLSDGTELLHINELPPPYQTLHNDWRDFDVDIHPLKDQKAKHGFAISGGIDTPDGPGIFVSHIDLSSIDNGRENLRIFDRICSINGNDLTRVTHDDAVTMFTSFSQQIITLHIRRLEPKYIEQIDLLIPSDRSQDPLGITIKGGSGTDVDDPGLFIEKIDSNGLLVSLTKANQIRLGDRLLTIKSNRITVDLRWITRLDAGKLIRRICDEHSRVSLIVAHQFF